MQVRDVTDLNRPGHWQDFPAATHRDAAVFFAEQYQGLREPMPKVVEVRAWVDGVSSVYEIRRAITAVPVDPHAR